MHRLVELELYFNLSQFKDHAVYRQFNGVVLDEEEGHNVMLALGSKKVRLIQMPDCTCEKCN